METKTAEEILKPYIYKNVEGFGDCVTPEGAESAMETYATKQTTLAVEELKELNQDLSILRDAERQAKEQIQSSLTSQLKEMTDDRDCAVHASNSWEGECVELRVEFEKLEEQLQEAREEIENMKRLKFTDLHTFIKKEVASSTFLGAVDSTGNFTGTVKLTRLTNSIQEYLSVKCSDISTAKIESQSKEIEDLKRSKTIAEEILIAEQQTIESQYARIIQLDEGIRGVNDVLNKDAELAIKRGKDYNWELRGKIEMVVDHLLSGQVDKEERTRG
jgi:hypothetical protein